MTIIQISKASLLFAELSGDKTDSSVHTKTSESAGVFQSLLAGMQEPNASSFHSHPETEANQVPLEETMEVVSEVNAGNGVPLVENFETNENSELSKGKQEEVAIMTHSERIMEDLIQVERTYLPHFLFEVQPSFQGGIDKKIIPLPTPIISADQLQSLAKWSVNKMGEGKSVLDSRLITGLETESSPTLNPVHKPVVSFDFETESVPILKPVLSHALETENGAILKPELGPVLETESIPILESETSPSLTTRTMEPQVTVPLHAPELPVDFQPEGVENLELTKPEFEKFRFEFTKNLVAPLRQAISDGGQTLRIQVFPENLGHIDIVVSMQDGKMHAQLTTSSTVTKEVLEMQLPQLRQSLLDQGIQLDQLEIDLFGEDGFDRERPNYQPGAEQNSSQTDRLTDWSDEVADEEILEENTSQAVDYSV